RRVKKAETTCARIPPPHPLNPFSRIQRIWIAFFSRNFDEVVNRANSLLEVWPGHPMAPFFRGQAYAVKHMPSEAADDCGKVIAATSGGFNLQATAMWARGLGVGGEAGGGRRLGE